MRSVLIRSDHVTSVAIAEEREWNKAMSEARMTECYIPFLLRPSSYPLNSAAVHYVWLLEGCKKASGSKIRACRAALGTSMGGLSFYQLPRSLIDLIQKGDVPYERIINPLIYQVGAGLVSSIPIPEDQDMISLMGIVQDLLFDPWMTATLTVLGVIIVIAIAMPVCGYFYLKMRKKGKCLASQYKNISGFGAKYSITLIFMFTCCVFLLTGILLGIYSTVQLSSGVDNFANSATTSFQSSLKFVRSTLDETRSATEDRLEMVLDSVNADLRNIREVLGTPIIDRLDPLYQQFSSDLDSFAQYLDNTYDNFVHVDETLLQLLDYASGLDTVLIKIQEELELFTDSCDSKRICVNAVPNLAIDNIRSELETLISTGLINSLTGTNVNNAKSELLTTSERLSMISGIIIDNFNNEGMITHLSPYDSTLNKLHQAIMRISSGKYLDLAVAYFHRIEYNLAIASSLLFVVIFGVLCAYVTATIIGLAGYRKEIQNKAHLRTAASDAGARIMIWVIRVSFPICGVLTFSTAFLYLLSTLGQKLCNDFSPPKYVFFVNSIDNKDLWNGNTFGTLAGQFEENLDISISDFLSHCGNNEAFYNALQVNRIFESQSILDSVITDSNILSNISFEDLVGRATDEIVTEETISKIESLPQYIVSTVDADDRIAMIGVNNLELKYIEVLESFEEFAVVFKSLNLLSPIAIYEDVDHYVVVKVENVIFLGVKLVEKYVNLLRTSLSETTPQEVVNIPLTISNFKTQAATIVSEEFEEFYAHLVTPVIEYNIFLQDAVENKIGRCGPLAAAYRDVYDTMCIMVLNGMNGIWCSILWCVCSILMLIVCGTVAIIFFKKDKNTDDASNLNFLQPVKNTLRGFFNDSKKSHPGKGAQMSTRTQMSSRKGTQMSSRKGTRMSSRKGTRMSGTMMSSRKGTRMSSRLPNNIRKGTLRDLVIKKMCTLNQDPIQLVTGCVSGLSGLRNMLPSIRTRK